MIDKVKQHFQENWDLTDEQLDDIIEQIEEYCHDCYWQGYTDREEEVKEYYQGFSHAKKSDMDGYE